MHDICVTKVMNSIKKKVSVFRNLSICVQVVSGNRKHWSEESEKIHNEKSFRKKKHLVVVIKEKWKRMLLLYIR